MHASLTTKQEGLFLLHVQPWQKNKQSLFLFLLPRMVMEWTKQHDRALLDEMTVSDLFQFKKGTPERGEVWDSIADNLNAMDYPKFKVAKRSCRDHWTLLRTKYKRKMSEELIVIVIVIARIGHSPWGFSGPILQCFLRLLGEIGRQLI